MKLRKEDIEDIIALSSMQEAMLFHYLSRPGDDQYFEQVHLVLEGGIIQEYFEKAWQHVVSINEVLRSVFCWEGLREPAQIILKEYSLNIAYHDLTELDMNLKQTEINCLKLEEKNKGFDLHDVPMRLILCKEEKNLFHLIISHHHILYDGWSNSLLIKEFMQAYNDLYEGKPLNKQIKTKYKEFIRYLKSENKEKRKSFWTEYLKGYQSYERSIDDYDDSVMNQNVGVYSVQLEENFIRELQKFIKKRDITVPGLFYGAWGALQQKSNLCNDVLIGITISGRAMPIIGIVNCIGLFINTVPLRVTVKAHDTVDSFLTGVDSTVKQLYQYEQTPLTDIGQYIQLDHSRELFDSLVVVENYPVDLELLYEKSAIKVKSFQSNNDKTSYPITIEVDMLKGWQMGIKYRESLFTEDKIKEIAEDYILLIKEMICNPDEPMEKLMYKPVVEVCGLESLDEEFDI